MIQFLVYCFALWFGAYLLQHNLRKPSVLWTGLGLIAYAVALAVDTLAGSASPARWLPVALTILFWIAAVVSILRPNNDETPRNLRPLIGVLTLFFGLGIALLVLPFQLFPADLAMLAISIDMVLLGYAVIRLDAFEEGQQFFPAAVRSLIGAGFITVLIGGQITLISIITSRDDETPTLLFIILYTLTGTAILLDTLSNSLENLLDRLAFARLPAVQGELADLRAAEQAVPLRSGTEDFASMSDETFGRLTRRALSAYGDLKRLAGSPLIDLPVIHERLRARGVSGSTLERAAELKTLLTESINRLKPRDGNFGTSDEWRYYNAVYYIYVMGLRPYSVRLDHEGLSKDEHAVLDWFQAQVPERTLYNWQNAAAKLIADNLKEQQEQLSE